MQGITGAVADWLIREAVIEESERELYEYAVHSLFMLIAPLFMAIVIGLFFGELEMSMVLILPFMIIRKYSGGYHAKRQLVCLLLSSALLIACFQLAKCLQAGIVLSVAVCVAALSLAAFSPVDSQNRRLTKEEIVSYGKTCKILVAVFVMLYFLLLVGKADTCATYLAYGIILPAVLQLPCVPEKCSKK